MTCREKLKLEHPELINAYLYGGGCHGCPSDYGYLPNRDGEYCTSANCEACWNQEIPETHEEAINRIQKAVADSMGAPIIKDSGNRRQFDTGAVRDMQEGKGRCDLMPLEVVVACLRADLCGNTEYSDDVQVLDNIATFQRTGDTRDLIAALDVFPGYNCWATMFLEVAKHFEEGAKKYGENNWQKGIPVNCYIDSAVRHYLKWLRGDKDEPHDRAFVWNLMCCIWEVDYREKKDAT